MDFSTHRLLITDPHIIADYRDALLDDHPSNTIGSNRSGSPQRQLVIAADQPRPESHQKPADLLCPSAPSIFKVDQAN